MTDTTMNEDISLHKKRGDSFLEQGVRIQREAHADGRERDDPAYTSARATYENAVKEYDVAIEKNPRDTWCRRAKAFCLLKMGERLLALEELRNAMATEPRNGDILADEAIILEHMHLYEEAFEEISKAIEIDSAKDFLHFEKGRIIVGLVMNIRGYYDNTSLTGGFMIPGVLYPSLLPRDPETDDVDTIGALHVAIEEFDRAIEISPNNARYHYWKTRALRESCSEIVDFADQDFGREDEFRFESRMLDSAIEEIDRAIAIDPDDSTYRREKESVEDFVRERMKRFREATSQREERLMQPASSNESIHPPREQGKVDNIFWTKSRNIIVDGTNVLYAIREALRGNDSPLKLSELKWVIAKSKALGLEPNVYVDASTRHRLDARDRNELEEMISGGLVKQAPAGTRADDLVLAAAEDLDAAIISNDRYKQYFAQYPWVKDYGRRYAVYPTPRGDGVHLLATRYKESPRDDEFLLR